MNLITLRFSNITKNISNTKHIKEKITFNFSLKYDQKFTDEN